MAIFSQLQALHPQEFESHGGHVKGNYGFPRSWNPIYNRIKAAMLAERQKANEEARTHSEAFLESMSKGTWTPPRKNTQKAA